MKVTLVPEHIILSPSVSPSVTTGNALIVMDSVSVKSTVHNVLALVATTLIVTGLPGKVKDVLVNTIEPPLPPTTALFEVAPSNNS